MRLFNIFAGDDKILQADEAQSLWNKLKTSASSNKKGDNSVFDNDEMQKFLDKNKDIKATKTKFSLDALTNMISQVFGVQEPQTTQQPDIIQKPLTNDDLAQYTPEEIENISLQTISEDTKTARELYDAQNNEQGSVSKFVNAAKENFDTEFASSRVGRYIRKEELCAELLERSKSPEGLSEKEYLEAKIDFVMSLIRDLEQYSVRTEVTQGAINIFLKSVTLGIANGKETKNSKELAYEQAELKNLKAILASLRPEEINALISQLTYVKENPDTLSEYNLSFGGKTNTLKPQTVSKSGLENQYTFSPEEYEAQASEGSLASLNNTYKKMSFEEVFQKERGVEYNSDLIMDYTKKNSYMQFLLGIHNRREQVAETLKEARFIMQGGTAQEIQQNARILMRNLTTALKTVYGNDTAKIQEFIESIYPNIDNKDFVFANKKPEIITNENGEFVGLSFGTEFDSPAILAENGKPLKLPSLDAKIDDLTIDSMIRIADELQSDIDKTYEQYLDGKTIEEYGDEVKQSYAKAYGNGDAQAMANAYVQSQQEGVGYVKMGVSTVGMVVMVAGQLIPVGGQVLAGQFIKIGSQLLAATMIYGGLTVATLGGSALTATELATKNGEVTKEELQDLAKEVATSLALTASGMKIGKISEGVYLAVAKHCPKLVALASEIGTDATMSLIADLAITGEIDLSGEGIAQLQSVLVGVMHAKGNFKNYLNTHALDSKPINAVDAKKMIASAARDNRPLPIIPSDGAIKAAKTEPTNAHKGVSNFYKKLSLQQKAIVDKYRIGQNDIVNIHGVLKIKLTKYDTPEIIESRYKTAIQGGSLLSSDISPKILRTIADIQHALMSDVPRERKLYIITGRAGGGKTTIAQNLKLDKSTFMPDADELKPFLPGYRENGASYVHGASVALNTVAIEEAFSKGINVTIQTTGWKDYIAELVSKAKKNGYTNIVLIHTNITPENSIIRANSRAAKSGRTVDPAYIESATYIDEVVKTFSNPAEGISKIIIYDNNGSSPVEVTNFNTVDEKVKKVKDTPE